MLKNIYTRCGCLLKRKKYKKGVICMQMTVALVVMALTSLLNRRKENWKK